MGDIGQPSQQLRTNNTMWKVSVDAKKTKTHRHSQCDG